MNPVKCFVCSKISPLCRKDTMEQIKKMRSYDYSDEDIVDALNLKKDCCRTMVMQSVDVTKNTILFKSRPKYPDTQ
jgi:DNA-directed RNA polymerase subunit N (RpoN/RPB10)